MYINFTSVQWLCQLDMSDKVYFIASVIRHHRTVISPILSRTEEIKEGKKYCHLKFDKSIRLPGWNNYCHDKFLGHF